MKTLCIILVINLYALTSLMLQHYDQLDIARGIVALDTGMLEVGVDWVERCLGR